MPTLLDGLIWRSRYAVEGRRRVNYYVKHLIEDSEGNFNQALKWVAGIGDSASFSCFYLNVLILFSLIFSAVLPSQKTRAFSQHALHKLWVTTRARAVFQFKKSIPMRSCKAEIQSWFAIPPLSWSLTQSLVVCVCLLAVSGWRGASRSLFKPDTIFLISI